MPRQKKERERKRKLNRINTTMIQIKMYANVVGFNNFSLNMNNNSKRNI